MAAGETEIERLVVRFLGDARQYMRMLEQAKQATGQAATVVERAGRRIESIRQVLNRTGSVMQRFGRSWSMYITTPIVASATAMIKTRATFEAEMSKIIGLVGVARPQVEAWSGELLDMAREMGKAPAELARGMFFVTSAGFRGAAALDVLQQATKASVAGMGEIATIADAVTSAVNAYGHANLSATRATDILTAAVREGKLEAESLAPVMGRMLPMASAMGITFEDIAGQLAVMSRTGASAYEAAVSIQAIMMTLQKPAAEAVELVESVGLSFQQLRDIARQPGGILEVLRLLDERFKGNEEAMAAIVPNVRALRGVLNILAQDAGIVDQVMRNVRESTGMTEVAFKTATETIAFKFARAWASLKADLIEFGASVAEYVLPAFDWMRDKLRMVTEWWKQLGPEAKKTFLVIATALAAAGPVMVGLGMFTAAIGALISGPGAVVVLTGLIVGGTGLVAALNTIPGAADKALEALNRIPIVVDQIAVSISGLWTLPRISLLSGVPNVQNLPTGNKLKNLFAGAAGTPIGSLFGGQQPPLAGGLLDARDRQRLAQLGGPNRMELMGNIPTPQMLEEALQPMSWQIPRVSETVGPLGAVMSGLGGMFSTTAEQMAQRFAGALPDALRYAYGAILPEPVKKAAERAAYTGEYRGAEVSRFGSAEYFTRLRAYEMGISSPQERTASATEKLVELAEEEKNWRGSMDIVTANFSGGG